MYDVHGVEPRTGQKRSFLPYGVVWDIVPKTWILNFIILFYVVLVAIFFQVSFFKKHGHYLLAHPHGPIVGVTIFFMNQWDMPFVKRKHYIDEHLAIITIKKYHYITMTSTQESVVDFLSKKNIPFSLKTIAMKLKMKKRPVLAVCHQDPRIKKTHPSHCGSGKQEASLFVLSEDSKWLETKYFIG